MYVSKNFKVGMFLFGTLLIVSTHDYFINPGFERVFHSANKALV